jgi:hypothetical protein
MINKMIFGIKDDHVRINGIKFFDRGDGYAGEVGNKHFAMVILAYWKFRSLHEERVNAD